MRYFDGDFDLLPFAAGVRFGQVPMYPTQNDFQAAAVGVSSETGTWDHAAEVWHLEAVRERRQRHAAAFDDATLKAIALRVADRLYREARDD